jgi:carbon starvation protein CstA
MDLVLSLVMLAAVALLAGAVVLFRRGLRKQPALMVVLSAILLANALIWSIPNERGQTLLESDLAQ